MSNKIKVLITGPVCGSFKDLSDKLNSLQKSKAGPFDVCFCTGPFFSAGVDNADDNPNALGNLVEESKTILRDGTPIPVYFCDTGTLPPGVKLPKPKSHHEKDEAEIELEEEEEDECANEASKSEQSVQPQEGVLMIAPNLYHLYGVHIESSQSADILNIQIDHNKPYLTVAFAPPNIRINSIDTTKLESKARHPSYVGCDILLTSEWGQGMASSNCLSIEDKALLQQSSQDINNQCPLNELGSFDVGEIASICRPRYHIAPSVSSEGKSIYTVSGKDGYQSMNFLQSQPYSNPPSMMSSGLLKNYHISRFLALCPVVDAATAKAGGKHKKFIHAVGIEPLWTMDRITATTIPDDIIVVPNPYTDEAYSKDAHTMGSTGVGNNGEGVGNIGLSQAQARRLLSEESGGDQYRWNIRNGNSRKRPLGFQSEVDEVQLAAANDPNNCTLFLHGLHKDVSKDLIHSKFQVYGCINVRFPSSSSDKSKSKTYCFLDFNTHNEAASCLLATQGQIEINNAFLKLRWSSGSSNSRPPPPPPYGAVGIVPPPPPPPGAVGIHPPQQPLPKRMKKERLTESEASDSSTLFVHVNVNSTSGEQVSEYIKYIGEMAQSLLEIAINGDVSEGDERVTAESEPALRVVTKSLMKKQNCGFMDFASHAAASMAIAVMTGNTDGGDLLSEHVEKLVASHAVEDTIRNIQIWWAKAKESKDDDLQASHDGKLRLKNKHFPPDARTDCWFCLASPTCERHLIVSVFDSCYIAMPKGGVNQHHTLIVPVNHGKDAKEGKSNATPGLGAFIDSSPDEVEEILRVKEKLRDHARSVLNKGLFVFERAIPTRGGYHAHINCIPIDEGVGNQIMKALKSAPFKITEIQNPDLSINTILKNASEDSTLKGYFYVEVMELNKDIKRYLYTLLNTNDNTEKDEGFVPIQYGRELLASVLGDSNISHWKGCLIPKEREEELTEEFRESFTPYLE